jgi:hypothetical protein
MEEIKGWKGSRYKGKNSSQQASRVYNITYESEYLMPDYDLEILENNIIWKQGLLLCGKLTPKRHTLPGFSFRWDEKADALDIDMNGESKHVKDWKYSRNGYAGHHATKTKKEGRHFHISIKTPTMKVFDGSILFNLARDATTSIKTGSQSSVEISVNKKSP